MTIQSYVLAVGNNAMSNAMRTSASALLLIGLLVVASSLQNTGCMRRTGLPTFTLNVDTWVGYAPFWLAKERGLFQSEGIDVNIVTVPDVGQRKATMLKGATDGIAETVDMLVLDREERVPSVAVMVIDFSNGADGILAIDEIRTVEDLQGKKVAVQRNYASEALLNYLLKSHGISPSAVEKIDMEGGAAGAAFVSGQVDVAVTFEPWLSKAKERRGGRVLISSADVPGVIVDILSIRKDYLQQNEELVGKVMRSWFKALDYWKENPGEANAIMAKHYSSTPDEFGQLITGLTWPSYEKNRAYLGTEENPGSIYGVAQTFVEVFLETGQIGFKPDMTQGIDRRPLYKLYDHK
jgi:NitT/TauT family transport system substrate-binding protein